MKALFWSQDNLQTDRLDIALSLRWPGFERFVAEDGNNILTVIQRERPDILIIYDGSHWPTVCSTIKDVYQHSEIPIVVIGMGDSETEVFEALESGANDYIRRSCSVIQVMARIAAVMRRTEWLSNSQNGEAVSRQGDLVLDFARCEGYLGSTDLKLTYAEFFLLSLLMRNHNSTLTVEFISQVLHSDDDVKANGVVAHHISDIRCKLGDDEQNPKWIRTIGGGAGYRFEGNGVL